MDKGTRMGRTLRHATRAKREYVRVRDRSADAEQRPLGYFRKYNGRGCSCRRNPKGRPKQGGGLCRAAQYHPCVYERIDGKRLCRAWSREIDVEGFDEGRLVKRREW